MVLEQQQIDVVGVVRQRRGQEGEVAGDAGIAAAYSARGIQDRVGRVARVSAGLRLHLHHTAIDGRRAGGVDAIALARGVDLDLVDRAGVLHEVAVDGEGTDRVTRGDDAVVGDQAGDGAVAAQGAGRTDRDVAGEAAVHRQSAGRHRGRTGVGVGAGEIEGAQTLLGQAAGARDRRRERGVAGAVRGQGAAA